jgi:protein-disulfide isomerase
MKRRLFLGGLSASVVGGGAYILTRPQDGTLADPFMAANAQSTDADPSAIKDMVIGAEDAPITIVEYASFTCPHCASFHADQYPQLKESYVDTGKVRFIYREVFFDRPGLWASMMARCGDGVRFFGLVDMIYARQRDWTNGDGAAIANKLRRIGISAGLAEADVDACMKDAEMAQNLVGWYQANADADEVQSTPTLLIDGVKFSNMSYPDLVAILDEKLGA